jgi:hypothetical protein
MDYQKQCQELDTKIRSIQKIEPLNCYVKDGIVNIENWRKQTIRPLFIGKEAHGDGDGKSTWSITNWMNEDPIDVCRSARHSWQKTAYIGYALQNGLAYFDDVPTIKNDNSVAEALRHIAFINVGKYGAETSTPWPRLNSMYAQNRSVLHEQIALYQPNVIIGWNTLSLFENDGDFTARFGKDKQTKPSIGGVDCWTSNGKLFISAYHPASFIMTQEAYVDGIVSAVRDHIEDIDLSLPIL